MAAKRILFFDGHRVVAYLWNRGHVRREGEFQADPVGLEAFDGHLRRHHTSLFYLLSDVAEEGFQLEDIPNVGGRDRIALIKRRLGQYFYGTPLSVAISLGRSTEGRRDEKILFAALTRHEAFVPWLDIIHGAEIILAGIYSVPLLLADLGPKLLGLKPGEKVGRLLLVTHTRAGVRQTFFDEGKLHFSRLTQLATHSLDELAVATANESKKIYQYLVGQRQIPRGSALRTVVLAPAGEIPTFTAHCRGSADIAFEFLDLGQALRQEGVRGGDEDTRAESLLVHRLASHPPSRQFARSTDRKLFRLWQIRFALASSAWIVLAGCLLFAAKTALQWYEIRQRIELINAQSTVDGQRYQAILDALPKTDLTPENLRALMGKYDDAARRTTMMEPLLIHLGQAMAETPRIELVRLEWKITDQWESPEKVGAGATAKPASPVATPPATPPAPATQGPWGVLEVHGQLPIGLASDLRAQIDLVEQFANRLKTAEVHVVILSMPFDVEPGKPLKSRGDPASSMDAPKFTIRLGKKS